MFIQKKNRYHGLNLHKNSQKWSRNDPQRLNLGNECIFLHLTDPTDTISYVLGPGDAKQKHKTVDKILRYKKNPDPTPQRRLCSMSRMVNMAVGALFDASPREGETGSLRSLWESIVGLVHRIAL